MKLSIKDLMTLGVLTKVDPREGVEREGFLYPNEQEGFLILYNDDRINYIFKNSYEPGSWIVCPHDDDGGYSFPVPEENKMEEIEIYKKMELGDLFK